MKLLRNAFERNRVILDLEATDLDTAIAKTMDHMVESGILSRPVADQVEAALIQREKEAPTAIGQAAAIPHAYLPGIEEQVVFFVRLARPMNLGAPDGIPTHFLFFLLGPPDATAQHLDTLANVARMMSDDEFRYEVGLARTNNDLTSALDHFTARTRPEPQVKPAKSDALEYTGKLCGGLIRDIQRRLPFYKSDFLDGLHRKALSSTLFLFFACLAPAVTFGGVMAVQTGDNIGAVEMITASAVCGSIFALVSGQPLVILGGTGPLLVFTAILYRLCTDLEIPFLPTYAWVGLWSSVFLVILAVTDASFLMRYFTRFTDETFSALISVIFIYEAIKSLVHVFDGADDPSDYARALLSLLLALGTFYVAMSLSRFRRSSYLRPRLREFLADFGPAIALGAMTLIAIWFDEVNLTELEAPDRFETTSGRPWVVNLLDAPMWARFAAIGPALLVTVLVFLDQNITARLVNSPDHRLNKGEAYHLGPGRGRRSDRWVLAVRVALAGCRHGSLAEPHPQSGHDRGGYRSERRNP